MIVCFEDGFFSLEQSDKDAQSEFPRWFPFKAANNDFIQLVWAKHLYGIKVLK